MWHYAKCHHADSRGAIRKKCFYQFTFPCNVLRTAQWIEWGKKSETFFVQKLISRNPLKILNEIVLLLLKFLVILTSFNTGIEFSK